MFLSGAKNLENKKEYINERTLRKVLANMRKLDGEIKGDA